MKKNHAAVGEMWEKQVISLFWKPKSIRLT